MTNKFLKKIVMILHDLIKKNIFKITLTLVFFGINGGLYAQKHTVSGFVKDAESAEIIPGAVIMEIGTDNATVSDFEGNYSIVLNSSTASLDISYIGYENFIIPVNGQAIINASLKSNSVSVDEVVVVGYGSQKKKVVTGSISSVSSEDINSTPTLRIDQAMQGRMAGVQVTNLSGQPGEEPTVIIRGAGTTGNARPLYIVDGMAVGGIDYLNPGDIESIDVLKDAASAAIYGSRAANGVVLITTKGGKQGKMKVTYSGYYGVQNVTKTIDMLDAEQYKLLMNDGARNAGLSEPFDMNEIPKYDTDWQKELFQNNSPMTNHEFNVSGGNEKSTYSTSMSYFSQEGIIGGDKSQFERTTARLNARHQASKKFKIGMNMAFSHINRKGIASNQSFNGEYSSALNLDPLTPVFETDEDILNTYPYSDEPVVTNSLGEVYGISEYVGAEVVNPLALLETQTALTRVDKFVGSAFGELEIIEGLKFRTSIGIDLAYVLGDSYKPLFYLNGAQFNVDKTSVSKNIDRYSTWQAENTLTYTKSIGKHNLSILAGTTASKYSYENLTGFNTIVPINQPYLNMATDTAWVSSGGASHSALLSIFGRITYDYKDKYAFTGIIRRDGSSKFGSNNRYGIFPSVGFSWAISDEAFFPKLKGIEFVKLRTSWGINGNQEIGDYQFISLMDGSRGYIFSGGRITGASPAYIENADIHWEESEQIDLAIDLSAFNNKLTATIDYYIKTTNGLLERIPIPAHIGNDAPYDNVGSVQNKGIELSIDCRKSYKVFKYSVGINGAYNKNEMLDIGNEEGVLPGASWAIAGMITRAEEGLPIGYFWGYKTEGIFQTEAEVFQHIGITGEVLQPKAVPGDVIFIDVNKDGVLNDDDRTMIGNPTPDFTIGMNASAEYKQFDFSLLLSGAYGNDIFNGSQRQDLRYTNRTTAILDRWTEDNPSNEVPRYTWIDANNNYRVSDLYVEDGSYLRIKNIQLGYSLPNSVLNIINATKWRFYFSAENLLTFTKYTGADPEIGAMSSFDIGIDRGIYPQARIIRFGTSLTF